MTATLVALTLNEIHGAKIILPKIDRTWCDQILILDGGSKDGTIEWCRAQGYEVYVQRKPGIRYAYLEARGRRVRLERRSCDRLSLLGRCDKRR